ncbi:MAG: diguanylate cyclase, partial [Aquificaceae bacterium]|nr:diguanylate cyclase [Aquificaceae bacterium]
DATLGEAFAEMKKHNKGYVLLFMGESPVGILTERDLVRLVTDGVSLEERAIEHASKNLISVKEYRDIYYALSLMIENGIRRLLVRNENGRFLGTLEMEKVLIRLEEDDFRKKLRVRDLVTDGALIFVEEGASLFECLKLMREKNIGAIPVLRDGYPVGIITERDIVRIFDTMDPSHPVKFYMSSPVITVKEDTLVETAVKLMEEKGIRRLVVVGEEGKAVGVISNREIARNIHESYLKFLERKLKHAKDVLNLLPEPTFEILDLYTDQVVVWMNAKAVDSFGNLIDMSISKIIPEREWAYVYARLIKDKKLERYRFSADDQIYELSASYVPLETERIRGRIKLILRDITQEISSQRVVLRELDNYKRIINSTDDMIILYEASTGIIKMANFATLRKLGYTEEELKKLTIFHIVQADPELIKQNIERIVRKDEVIRGQRFYKDAHGKHLPVEISATKVYMNHEPYILIVARDISERLRLEKEIEKKTKELESIHDFIINLNRCNSEGEAYNMLAHILIRVVGVDTLAIYRINPSLNRVVDTLVYGEREYKPCVEENQDPIFCKVFQSVQPFLVKDKNSYSCPSFKSDYGSYMCMSVVSGGRTIALLSMISRKEGFFTRDRADFIENIVHTFSPFLSNLRLIEVNRELSIRDPLTNLYNRRFVTAFLLKEIEKARREGKSLSLLLVDLDHFKNINDAYGHQMGDICLKVFSDVMAESVRSMDIVGRWGGEEFIIILPFASRVDAVSIANRIREKLKQKIVYAEHTKPISLTASFGVAVYPDDGESMDELLKVADDKLYRAKEGGRDMIVP